VTDDRLDEQAGERGGDPQIRQGVDVGAQVWKMRLVLAFCRANPIWMPMKPNDMLKI